MREFTNTPPATFETVWAALMETRMQQAETDRMLRESIADYERRMKRFEETMGAWSNNHGCFAEEYFFNSFDKGRQNFFGEKFDEIMKNFRGAETKDEFDIVMINGSYVGLATMAFYPKLEEACIKQGIAVIKQVGNTVVVNDAHLKVY